MDPQILVVIALFFAGAGLGATVLWLLLKTKVKADMAAQLATLQERLTGRDREVQRLQAAHEAAVAEHNKARTENSQLKAELEGERRAGLERSESFRRGSEELASKFKALSRDALKDNNQSFLDLARATLEKFQESAKGDLDKRQQAIDQLVKPLKDPLEKVDGKIGETERAPPVAI